MRFAIYGAGAIGAYLGAKLSVAGEDVALIARGPHLKAMRENGVQIRCAEGDFYAKLLATDDPAEVGEVDVIGGWNEIFVGEVKDVRPHPNADRLRLCVVTTGAEEMEVVCGAPNVAAGQRVAFARPGARLLDPDPHAC